MNFHGLTTFTGSLRGGDAVPSLGRNLGLLASYLPHLRSMPPHGVNVKPRIANFSNFGVQDCDGTLASGHDEATTRPDANAPCGYPIQMITAAISSAVYASHAWPTGVI